MKIVDYMGELRKVQDRLLHVFWELGTSKLTKHKKNMSNYSNIVLFVITG